MDTLPVPDETVGRSETPAEREQRLVWESAAIDRALADYDAGFYVDGHEVLAWLDSLGTDAELPLPPVRRR